jgi:head-tail adaptor
MSIKTFLLRKMLSSQMKGVPQADQDKVFAMLEKNPDLFQKIGMEVQEEMKRTGADQMTATMKIVKKYEADLKGLL